MTPSLSILLLHSRAAEARALLAEISGHRLLRPFVLLDEHGEALLMVDGMETLVDLDDYLARQRPGLIRLVNLGIAADSDYLSCAKAERVREHLDARCRPVGISFVALALAVPHRGAVIPAEFFGASWNANLILEPLDSAGSPGMMSVDMTPEKTQTAAVVAGLTIGGVWAWLPEGPLDEDEIRFVEGRRFLTVARLAVRVVDAGDLTARLVGWALDPGGAWPTPSGCAAHGAPDQAVRDLAPRVAQHTGFRYRKLEPPERHPVGPVGVLEALGIFFGSFLSSLQAMPGRAWRRLRDRAISAAESFVQAATFGNDSEIVVAIGKPRELKGLVDPLRRVSAVTTLPDIRIPAPVPQPEMWRDFLGACLGSVDGGDFSEALAGVEPTWQGKRAVLSDRSYVVQEPSGDAGIGFLIDRTDAETLGFGESDSNETSWRIGGADVASCRVLEARFVELGLVPNPNTQQIDAQPDTAESKPPESPPSTNGLVARYQRWRRNASKSLMWHLGEELADGIEAALSDISAAENELAAISSDIENYRTDEKRALRSRRIRVAILTVLLLLIIAGIVSGFAFLSVTAGLIGVALLFVWLIGAVLALLSAARDEVRLKYRLKELEDLPTWLLKKRRHAADEAVRLTYLNDQLIDWADIVAHSIHRPWGHVTEAAANTPWRPSSALLGFTVGTPEIDDETMQGEVVRLRRSICRPGWLSAVFLEQRALWARRYERVAGVDTEQFVDAGADTTSDREPIGANPATGEPVFHPRLQLAADLRSERYVDELRREQVQRLRDQLARTDAERLVARVHSNVEGLSDLSPREFIGSLAEFDPLPAFASSNFIASLSTDTGVVERSVYGVSDSIEVTVVSSGRVDHRRIAVADVPERFVLAGMRLDMTARVPEREITLLAPSVAPKAGPKEPPADSAGGVG